MTELKRLKDLEEFPELYRIKDDEKLKLAKDFKSAGVDLFKEGDICNAFYRFSDALKLLIIMDGRDGGDAGKDLEEKDKLLIQLYNNIAGCHLSRKNWESAIEVCDSAVMRDPLNVKALYRRGIALMEIEEYERAQADFSLALDTNPSNDAVKVKMQDLVQRIKTLNAKYAQAMKKMFQ